MDLGPGRRATPANTGWPPAVAWPVLPGVQGLDFGGEVLRHQRSLHLERWSDVVVLGGEVDRKHLYLADRLGPRHRLIRVVDSRLEFGQQARVIRQGGRGGIGWLVVLLLPVLQRLRVEGDQTGDERLAVTDHHALADQRVRPEPVLKYGRGDVLAARGDDELLLPPGHPQEPLFIQRPKVAGVQPALCIERLGCALRIVPVAGEDDATLEQYLSVVRNSRAHTGNGLAHRPDLVPARLVYRGCGRGLGHAIALEHRDSGPAEKVTEPLAERRAAGNGVRHVSAYRRPQLAVHKMVKESMPDPKTVPCALARRSGLTNCDGRLGSGSEDLALGGAGRGRLLRGVEDLLEDPRHSQQERGPELGQAF